MTTLSDSADRTVLLILPEKKRMYPLTTRNLVGESRRRLENAYRAAMIVDGRGIVRRVERIEVLSPWGASIGRQMLSRITDTWKVDVHLSEPQPLSVDALKKLIVECLVSGRTGHIWQADDATEKDFVAAVTQASCAADVVAALHLPAPEEALDVL